MNPADVQSQLKKGPFPMRLCFSDGSTFELRLPELLMVSRLALALTIGSDGKKLAERIILLDPLHLVRIEPMNGNGSHRKRRRKTSNE